MSNKTPAAVADAPAKLNGKQRKAEAKRLKAEQEAAQRIAASGEHTVEELIASGAVKLNAAEAALAPKAPRTTKSGLPALPRLKRARKPKPAKVCACGCGGNTKGGRFIPGHDARLHGWALRVQRGVCTLTDVSATDGPGVAAAVKAHLAATAVK